MFIKHTHSRLEIEINDTNRERVGKENLSDHWQIDVKTPRWTNCQAHCALYVCVCTTEHTSESTC